MASPRAEPSRQNPETAAVRNARPVALKHPGVGRLVAQRLVAFGERKVRGNGDAVRPAVLNLAPGELSPGQANHRRPKTEPRRQPVVETLQLSFGVRLREREEKIQEK